MPGKPGPRSGARVTQEVARELCKRIYTGELQPGDLVPSQRQLAKQYDVDQATASHAVDIAQWKGLVTGGGRGRRHQVADRKPVHGLALNPHRLGKDQWRAVQPSDSSPFTQAERTGKPKARWKHRTLALPAYVADPLGFQQGADALERAMLLTIDGKPVLMSISYLPAELAGGDKQWRGVAVAALALTGHAIEMAMPIAVTRIPMDEHQEILGMDSGVPVYTICQPYRVILADRRVPAGVIVITRGDQVYLH